MHTENTQVPLCKDVCHSLAILCIQASMVVAYPSTQELCKQPVSNVVNRYAWVWAILTADKCNNQSVIQHLWVWHLSACWPSTAAAACAVHPVCAWIWCPWRAWQLPALCSFWWHRTKMQQGWFLGINIWNVPKANKVNYHAYKAWQSRCNFLFLFQVMVPTTSVGLPSEYLLMVEDSL